MFFSSVFLKMHKKKLLTAKNGQICVFWCLIAFLMHFKNTDQKKICASIVNKAESDQNTK